VVDVVVQRLALQLIEREAREPLGRGVHVRAPLVRVHDQAGERGVLGDGAQSARLVVGARFGIPHRPARVQARGDVAPHDRDPAFLGQVDVAHPPCAPPLRR
jgi:hypothetical protein